MVPNEAHAQAWFDAFAEYGLPIPYEKIRPLIGMGGDKVLREAAGLDPGRGPSGGRGHHRPALRRLDGPG